MKKTTPPVLHLNLMACWYNMIDAGIKLEEYRDKKEYFNRIFGTGKVKIKRIYYNPTDVVICYSNGYHSDRRQMSFWCAGLRSGFGNPRWGATPEKEQYILKIGQRYKSGEADTP